MQRHKLSILFLVIIVVLSSCASTSGSGEPGWLKDAPSSRSFIYAVGSAKMTNEKNSSDASYGLALTSLSSYLSPFIDDAVSSVSAEETAQAYETIKNSAVNAALLSVKKEEVYVSSDGTVWTLVSVSVENLPSLYASAAEDYVITLEEKRVTTEEKLEDLLKSIEITPDENGQLTLSSEAVALKEKAEAKAGEIIAEIDSIEKNLEIETIVGTIRKNLEKAGFKVK